MLNFILEKKLFVVQPRRAHLEVGWFRRCQTMRQQHDGESGDSKSLGLMSGGERVWVNECLTRAVALYLAQHAGRRPRIGPRAKHALHAEADIDRKRAARRVDRDGFAARTDHADAVHLLTLGTQRLHARLGLLGAHHYHHADAVVKGSVHLDVVNACRGLKPRK